MPTLKYHRFWCSKCKDFTLHQAWSEKGCNVCGTVTETYSLSDVPEEKILEQRERYKKSKPSVIDTYLSFARPKSQIEQIAEMLQDREEFEIIETDAGQKAIDDKKNKERADKWEKIRVEKAALAEEYKKFKGKGRNDTCPCGSGNKYKKCCISKFANI